MLITCLFFLALQIIHLTHNVSFTFFHFILNLFNYKRKNRSKQNKFLFLWILFFSLSFFLSLGQNIFYTKYIILIYVLYMREGLVSESKAQET